LKIILFSILNIFESPQGIFWGLSLGNCPQHCKQDLPKTVGIAAHAFISKRNP
jgi:hypothetical protein